MIFEILFLLFALQIEKCSAQVDKPVSQWTACSVTCGKGTRTKETCQESSDGDENCTEEIENCNIQVCSDKPVSQWTECSVTCGKGTRTKKTCKDSSSNGKKMECKKETENCYKHYCSAPCQCNLMISDLKLCMALHKDDISINFNGTCYPEKLFNAIEFLKEKLKVLTFQDKEFEICQTKLKKNLPKFIFEYNKCCKNINFYLRKWKSVLQLKINKLSNEYDEYDQLLFKVTDMVMFEMAEEIKIEKDYFITSLPTLGNTYSISFELMIRELPPNFNTASIIYLTEMNNKVEKIIFDFHINNGMNEIELGITEESLHYHFSESKINESFMNKWLKISISKVKINGNFIFTVKVNGDTWIYFLADEKHYSDIKVFASKINELTSWYPTSDKYIFLAGSIKNIKIENLDLMEKTGID